MDWKSQLASSIEAALERSMCATVEESAEETARRRKRWLRIQLVEDRVRRDPVYAEKLARRHAAFRDSISAAEEVAKATSTSTAPATILTACAVRDGNLDARPPTTCSTQCPSRAAASSVSALTATAAPTSSTSTGGIVPERCYYDLEPAAATSTPTCSRSDLHAPAASDNSKMATSIQMAAAADSIAEAPSICNDSEVALVAPITCSTQCPRSDVTVSASASALSATSISSKVSVGGVPKVCSLDREPNLVTAMSTTSSADSPEDKELQACLSVERPLMFVAMKDVADDCSFVTSAPAVPLAVAALGVHDGSITSKHTVAQPLFKTKEQKRSPLLPQLALATVIWGTSVNQLHAKYSGICSDHCYATSHSFSLLPWDPGEKTKSGYAKTQEEFHGLIQVLCSDQNALGNCSFKGIYVEFLKNLLVCVGPFSRQYLECLITCAATYPAKCAEQVRFVKFLLGSFGVVQKNRQYLAQSGYLSLATSSIPYHYALLPAGMIAPYGSVSLLWEMPWSSLFDILRAVQGTRELRSCILWSDSATSFLLACENATLKGPMQQWDPGIARLFHNCTQHCHVSNLLISCPRILTDADHSIWITHHNWQGNYHYSELVGWSYLQPEWWFCILGSILFCCVLEQWEIPWTVNLVSLKSWFQYYSAGQESLYNCNNFQWTIACYLSFLFPRWFIFLMEFSRCEVVTIRGLSFWSYTLPRVDQMMLKGLNTSYALNSFGVRLLNTICLQDCVLSCYNGHIIQYGFKVIQWKIAWSVNLQLFTNGVQIVELSCAKTVQALLLADCSWSQPPRNDDCHYLTSSTTNILPLLCFLGLFIKAQPKAYFVDKVCADQDCNLDVFRGQVRVGRYYLGVFLQQVGALSYINLAKVCLDYKTHRNLGVVMKHRAPWDPGGSSWHRLEVKPKFKEGRMLATSPNLSCWAMGCHWWAWAALKSHEAAATNTGESGYGRVGLELDGFGLLASVSFLSGSSSCKRLNL